MQALCNSRAGQEKCLVVVAVQILANGAYDKKPVIGNMGKIESQRPSWKEDADPGQVPFRHASPPPPHVGDDPPLRQAAVVM